MRLLSILFVGFQSLDIATTAIGINMYGFTEGNPLINAVGWYWGMLIKLVVVVFILWIYNQTDFSHGRRWLRIVTVITAVAVAWNATAIGIMYVIA